MRRIQRIVLLVGLVALTPVLSGCESFDMDKLDVFGLGEKKKLPGDRKPVFPEGVPGVTQGIPPEYIKGNQPPAETAVTLPAEPDKKTAVAAPPAPKPKAKPRPKPATASAPSQVTVQPAAAPQPQPAQQPSQQPWPAPSQSTGTAPWPSAPPPGTFTR